MSIPVAAATVILLRPSPAGFEVLMVERNSRGQFGSIVVFPGGSVDSVDIVDRDDGEAAIRRAAVRELAEEAGILLTSDGAIPAPPLKGVSYYRWIDEHEIETRAASLVLVSRWVTPETMPKRYDTRFYLAADHPTPEVRIDRDELVGHSWVTPARALEHHHTGDWAMILPTLAHVRWLARRSSIEDAMDSAKGADGRTLIEPRIMEDGSVLPVHLPAEGR